MATVASPASFGTVQLVVCSTIVAAALSLATSLADAGSQEKSESPQHAAPTDGIPEIVVKGTRPIIERRIHAFVSGITRQTASHQSLARWRKPICPLVAGLSSEQAEFVLERVSQVAISTGAPLAPDECRANFYIVLTSEPEELLQLWRKRDGHLFGGALRATFDGQYRFDGPTPVTIDRFLNTPRPIRVWYNTEVAKEFHQRWQATRFEWDVVIDLSSVIVVVDAGRVKGIGLDQLADYTAMVGLAKLAFEADLGDAPTVLRLFANSGDVVPQRMSSWDRAFLRAVYDTSQISRRQQSQIARRMVDTVAAR